MDEVAAKEIELSELRRAIDMIFDYIDNDLGLKTIRLDHDYYADLDLEEKFEVLSKTKDASFLDNLDIGLGQLYDDWEFLEKMMQDGSSVELMFEHVAPILRYLGYKAREQANKNEIR